MTLKMKLTSTIAAFLLILGLTIMGVMAAPSATVNLGGSISFTATDVNAKVTGDISGATNSPEELPELLFSAGLDDAALAELNADKAKWGECDLEFASTGKDLSILVTIENLAERPLYASINTNANMTADVTSTMEELTAADAESGTPYTGDTITIPAKSGETTYFAYIRLSLEVNNKNASLGNDATWGYDVVLNNEKPAEMLKYDFSTDGTKTATVSMTGVEVTKGDIVIPSTVINPEDGFEYNVTGILASGFANNTSITGVTIPASITSIGSGAFTGCSNLKNLIIEAYSSTINSCINQFSNLESLTINSGEVPSWFWISLNKGTLKSLIVGDGVTSFSGGAVIFPALETIKVGENNPVYSDRGLNAIVIDKSNTIILGCKTTIINNTITAIAAAAFKGCTGLTSVTIPASISSIEATAFDYCTNLSTMTVKATTPPTLGDALPTSITKIYVPTGYKSAYTSAAYWTDFADDVFEEKDFA